MTIHKVKSSAHFFDAIKAGKKLHDLRKLDRDYKVGDILILQRYDNIDGEYTGEELEAEITYITSNKVPCAFSSSALDRDYGIFSLKVKTVNITIRADQFDIQPNIHGIPMIKKNIGGPVAKGTYVIGERTEEQRVSSVSPSPNAEYYQNR